MASHFKRRYRTERNSTVQETEQDGAEAPLTLANCLNWKLGLKREILLAQAV
jgi:hypothetical protein